MIRLSVIVPTRNRRDVLMTRALPAMLNQQMRADEFEIVVVVDGSTDGTAAALRELLPPCSVIVIEQPGRGAGSARNTGIQAAHGDLLLFLDDDIVCEPGIFQRHVEAHHGLEPVLAYGPISIHPETPPSVMKFGTESWYRDYYSGLEARCGLRLPEDNFLISNSSMPRATVIECGSFDERMTAKEDYELGLRLWKKGLQFKFLPQAKVYEFFLKPLSYVVENDGKAFGETEILLSRKHPEYRPYSRFAVIARTTWGRRVLRHILAVAPVDPVGVLNLPLSICDKLSRFSVARRAGESLMKIGRSVAETRSAVRQTGSWKAFQREFGLELPVLLYHHVGPDHPETVRGLTVSPQKFERQIRWLAQRGFQGICPRDWLQWLHTGNGLPAKPILLSFDDAYADVAEYALPILRKYGFSGAVFVVTERLGATNTWDEAQGCGTLHLMTAEQIRYWDGQGIEFGAHSRTHAHLSKLSAAELSVEVVGSKNDLSALLGHPVVSFAYPYGDYNNAVLDLVRGQFDLAFSVQEGLNDLSGDPHLLKRAYIGPTDLMLDFAASVRRGGIRRIRDWRAKLSLRTRLKRLLGINRRRAGTGKQAMRSASAGHRELPPTGAAIAALFVALPAVLFYGGTFRHLVSLPYADDYEILAFLNQVVQAGSAAAKLRLFFAWQHNEYKLFFVNGVAWAQFAVLGHVNFAQLCVLGDSAVLVLAFILWPTFLPGYKNLTRRLVLFVPVAWLLFQMVYWETLNSALGALQNLWVIVFSLGAIRCLLLAQRKAYSAALVLCALATAASGNGFFVLPVGLVILAKRRQFARAGGLLGVSVVCIAAYAYHYNLRSSQVQPGGSVFSELRHWRPDFMIAFVGNAGVMASHPVIFALRRLVPGLSIPSDGSAGTFVSESAINLATCLALGTLLLVLFGWLMWRGCVRRNLCISSSVLFLLLTATGVTGLRSGFGLEQCLSPRYSVYGTLLLILAWMAVAEEFLERRSERLLRNGPYIATTVAAIVLALGMDVTGTRDLERRNSEIARGMQAFEHPATPESTEGPVLGDDPSDAWFRAQARETLTDSIRLGVYEPPGL